MTKIDALQWILQGCASYDTEASQAQRERIEKEDKDKKAKDRRHVAEGFVEGSEAHEYATMLDLPVVELAQGRPGQDEVGASLDMFASQDEALMPRFYAPPEFIFDLLPLAFGGEEPADAWSSEQCDEYGGAIAWDEGSLLFFCPRGVCRLSRAEWQSGRRACPGC